MATKCAQCGNTIQETFLKKILGTHMRKDGKRIVICSDCQRAQSR